MFDAPEVTTDPPDSFRILGVAPDWPSTAHLKVGGDFRSATIRDNAYTVSDRLPLTLVALLGKNRQWRAEALN